MVDLYATVHYSFEPEMIRRPQPTRATVPALASRGTQEEEVITNMGEYFEESLDAPATRLLHRYLLHAMLRQPTYQAFVERVGIVALLSKYVIVGILRETSKRFCELDSLFFGKLEHPRPQGIGTAVLAAITEFCDVHRLPIKLVDATALIVPSRVKGGADLNVPIRLLNLMLHEPPLDDEASLNALSFYSRFGFQYVPGSNPDQPARLNRFREAHIDEYRQAVEGLSRFLPHLRARDPVTVVPFAYADDWTGRKKDPVLSGL